MDKPHLSVIVLTLNEEANIGACLASVRSLGCGIHVVDSGSVDGTLAIAREMGAAITHHPFEGYAFQRNWAQDHLSGLGEWVLHLDADERLTPELVSEIQELFSKPIQSTCGFLFRKRTIFMGRWIRYGAHYPSYHLRLFRRDLGRCEDRLYDQHFLVKGAVQTLKNDYIDIVASDLNRWTTRHVHWAELEAKEALSSSEEHSGARVRPDAFGNPIERKRWLREGYYKRFPILIRPFLYWFYRYVLRLGFLDGRQGLVFHFLHACWFRFLVDAMILELRRKQNPCLHESSRSERDPSGMGGKGT